MRVLKSFLFFTFLNLFLGCKDYSNRTLSNNKVQDSISHYIDLAYDVEYNSEEDLNYIKKAEYFNNRRLTDSLYFINNFYISFIYFNYGLNNEYKKINLKIIEAASETKDTFNLARAYSYLGEYYDNSLKPDSALIYYQSAEKLFSKKNKNSLVAKMHLKMAQTKHHARDLTGSDKSLILCLNILRVEPNKVYEWGAYSLLGLNSLLYKEYVKSEEYLLKAIKIAEENNLEPLQYQSRANSYNNLATLYINQIKLNQAQKFVELAFNEPNLKEEYIQVYSSVLLNRGKIYFLNNDFDRALLDLREVLEISVNYGTASSIVDAKIQLAEYFFVTGQKDSANHYANSAYKNAKDANILNLQVDAIDMLWKINPDQDAELSKQHKILNDSLINMERKNSEKFARIEFETDEMRRQNEILSLRNRNIYTLAALIIAGIFIVYLFRERRNRLVRLRLLEAQQTANEEVYTLMLHQQQRLEEVVIKEKQRIGQDLHDGVLGRMFGARMNLDSMTKDLISPEAIEKRNHFIKELQEIEQDIREVSHELSREKSTIIDNFMLIFTQLLEDQKANHKTQLEYDVDANIIWDQVNNNIKINLYRIVQEALQNINKYAAASHIIVIIQMKGKKIYATITDDGVGFDVGKKSKGIGMKNIQSRVDNCMGSFTITSKKGEGTKVRVVFPLKY